MGVIDMADSSRERDLQEKLPLYAAAGIAEYWVVDLRARRLLRHREPRADGRFAEVSSVAADETVPVLDGTVHLHPVFSTIV
jgi:Uma2 family endonuclease